MTTTAEEQQPLTRADLRHELQHYATKADIAELRGELRTGLAELRGELHKGLAELRGELRADQAGLRGELQADLADWAAKLRREFSEDLRARFRVLQLTIGGIGVGLVVLNLALKFLT